MHPQTHADPPLKDGAAIGREHYIMECVADALFLAVLKLPQSNLVVKDIAEVDAAGRYIPFPLVCRWLTMPSRTPLGAYYIYQRRGYHSVRSLLRAVEGLKRRTGRSQIPSFSFVVNNNGNLSGVGYLLDYKTKRKR